MVQIGHFEKFLKVLIWLSCLVLEIVLGGHDILLIGAIRLLVIVVVASSNCDPLGALLLPLLPSLVPFLASLPVALDGASLLSGTISHHLEQRWPRLARR
jgi:hypothetical protein